ncbi:NmrA/HSCARG family protein [Streptomyces sp. NPDC126499]|uniref:NmrA/HSCARG family protein n=1 Tax=Streptomyces sp. NPDC126499 TaxID=3155314 RepID=UPI00331B3AE0
MLPQNPILVTGATGSQGGAVARALLAAGFPVRALVRDPRTPAAHALAASDAELVTGDLDDVGSLRQAARGAYGVFSVQPSDMADPRPEEEVRRGRNVADAAAAEGVTQLVQSSVGGADQATGVPHFASKAEIEAYVAGLDIRVTVLRPVFFMENWPYLWGGPVPLDADTSLQMIAVADIGRIAAEVFAGPGEFTGRTIEIAGDELTVRAAFALFAKADGRVRYERSPRERDAPMFTWLNERGYAADLAALRRRHPELRSLADWLREARTTPSSRTAPRRRPTAAPPRR